MGLLGHLGPKGYIIWGFWAILCSKNIFYGAFGLFWSQKVYQLQPLCCFGLGHVEPKAYIIWGCWAILCPKSTSYGAFALFWAQRVYYMGLYGYLEPKEHIIWGFWAILCSKTILSGAVGLCWAERVYGAFRLFWAKDNIICGVGLFCAQTVYYIGLLAHFVPKKYIICGFWAILGPKNICGFWAILGPKSILQGYRLTTRKAHVDSQRTALGLQPRVHAHIQLQSYPPLGPYHTLCLITLLRARKTLGP